MQSHGPSSHPAGDVTRDAKYTTIIRNNKIRDYKGWGIDLDDGSSNYDIYNNLCIGVSIKNREGDLRTVHNNIIINPARPPAHQVGCENNSDRWFSNIIIASTKHGIPEIDRVFVSVPVRAKGSLFQFGHPPQKGKWIKELDYNLYYNDLGHFKSVGEINFKEWKVKGFDEHSIFAYPEFVDPANEDFRVKPTSPALELEFKNFPMDNFGLQNFPKKWLAEEPDLPIYDYLDADKNYIRKIREDARPRNH